MQSKDTRVVLAIRHAESTFIKWYEENKPTLQSNEHKSAYDREFFYHSHCLREEFVDAPLSDHGVSQALNIVLPEVISKTVWVSPFRRALQTACLCLSKHPMRGEVTLRLHPGIKEEMSY